MKLRLKNNSVRLRLTQSETALLKTTGRVDETIEFGIDPNLRFVYAVESDGEIETIEAKIENNRLTICIPKDQADDWANSDRTGIEITREIKEGKTLLLLIEKDFSCLEPRKGNDDADTFPHPLAGQKC